MKHSYYWFAVVAIFVLTGIVFSPVLNNEFITTWDDKVYVTENPLIKSLSSENIREIFMINTQLNQTINNYHHLTVLSLAINYQISGLSSSSYILTNVLFHAINAVLVFIFIFSLSKRKLWAALLAGLWFGIHPMHVESVAWISERKDVLYAFFFVAGLITYLRYLKYNKTWMLIITFLLFTCSLLSKAMAVTFPVVLFLIDYYRKRSFSWKMVLEKVPFLILSVIFGIISLRLQSLSAIEEFETFSLIQRAMHASYGFFTYIAKFLIPVNLSAFYPYPMITDTGFLPQVFRLAPFGILILAAIFIFLFTRKGQLARVTVFGFLFFFVTIVLVLQFLSVGKAIMADRYTYLPYIGLTFILGMVLEHLLERRKMLKTAGLFLGLLFTVMSCIFMVQTWQRVKVWNNNISLWTDAINQYPDLRLNFIYEKRARVFLDQEKVQKSLGDYLTILKSDPKNILALESAGRIYGQYLNDLERSLEFLEKAYQVDSTNIHVLKNLGVAYGIRGEIRRSLNISLKAYAIESTDPVLLNNIANSYMYLGDPAKAEEFRKKATAAEK